MKQIASFPASRALDEYIRQICPTDAHINVQMRGVWVDEHYFDFEGGFSWLKISNKTERLSVVRAFTCNGLTHWTLEKWEHDNGYRCDLVNLSKAAFLDLIHS